MITRTHYPCGDESRTTTKRYLEILNFRHFVKHSMFTGDGEKRESEEDEKLATLSLSLTVSDKKALKPMALENDTTIAAMIHNWIVEQNRRYKNGKS